MERDPVCGMEFERDAAPAKSELGDHMYYFCSAECKQKFDHDHERYTAAPGEHQVAAGK